MKFGWRFGLTERCLLSLAVAALACGQGPGPGMGPGMNPGMGPGPGGMRGDGPMHHEGRGPGPMHEGPRSGFGLPGGKWWTNPEMVKRLSLTADQQRKMDDVLQQSRLKLIDLTATLQKEEVMMEDLMRGPQLDDSKILPAVDRIAQARAELEKANARMMLGIRHVLTPAQWEKLHSPAPAPMPNAMGPGPNGPAPRPPTNGPAPRPAPPEE
jgi:Spy/CpxP family protein refolding chaperone